MKKRFFAVAMAATMALSSVMSASAVEPVESAAGSTISGAFWTAWTESYELKDTLEFDIEVKGGDLVWSNVAAVFVNAKTTGTKAPKEEVGDTYKEYALVRGDNWGWGGGDNKTVDGNPITYEGGVVDLGDPDFIATMKDCHIDATITKAGNDVTMVYDIQGANGKTAKRTVKFTSDMSAGCYVFFVCDGSEVTVTPVEKKDSDMGIDTPDVTTKPEATTGSEATTKPEATDTDGSNQSPDTGNQSPDTGNPSPDTGNQSPDTGDGDVEKPTTDPNAGNKPGKGDSATDSEATTKPEATIATDKEMKIDGEVKDAEGNVISNTEIKYSAVTEARAAVVKNHKDNISILKDKKFGMLEIDLFNKDNGVQLTKLGNIIKVTIAKDVLPAEVKDCKKIAVYRADDDGKLTKLTTTVNADGSVTFETDHFSTYVFVEDTTPDAPSTPDNTTPDNTTQGNGGTTGKPGKTGDTAPIAGLVIVAGCALAVAVVSKKKFA